MPLLRFTRAAERDLLDIAHYIETHSKSIGTAEDFVGRLVDKIVKISQLPGRIGHARPELLDDARSYSYGKYVIFFRYVQTRRGETFEIINVIHGRRDISRFFIGKQRKSRKSKS